MRLIKLSRKLFTSDEKVDHYFNDHKSEFRSRNDNCGVFIFPKGWIAENGINPNETVLFSYNGNVVRVAKSLSGRLQWDGPEKADFQYCIQIDLSSLKTVSFPTLDLELALTKASGMCKSLTAQGWPILPGSVEVELAINRLISTSNIQ